MADQSSNVFGSYIEEFKPKTNLMNNDVFLLEDAEDTKKTTLLEIKKSFNGDINEPSANTYYSSMKVDSIKGNIDRELNKKASSIDLESVEKRIGSIVSSNPDGTKDNEIIDARDGEVSLFTRLKRDLDINNSTRLHVGKKKITESSNDSITLKALKSLSIGDISVKIKYNDIALSGTVVLSSSDKSINITRNIVSPDSVINLTIDSNDITIVCNIDGNTIEVTYEAYIVDTDYFLNEITKLEDIVYDTKDKCGLISDYGTYIYMDNITNMELESAVYDYSDNYNFNRNGHNSLQLKVRGTATTNPSFVKALDTNVELKCMTINYYIDKEVIKTFDSLDGIRIILSSDSPRVNPANYYEYNINNNEMLTGWNHLKKTLNEFDVIGSPDVRGIKSIKIEILRPSLLNGKELYINSIVFNQMMKPTLLFNFNGVYSKGFNYTYPYLYARKIPFTLFTNNGTTLSNDNKIALMTLISNYNCEISTYGCNPFKELLNQTNNPYEQYQALRTSKEYIQKLFCGNPVSFSVPNGDLMDITYPLLKDLGYKIARVETQEPCYCSFFSKDDFCIPVIKLNNNTTTEEVIDRINYAISSGQSISLFTNNITEYGDEANCKQMMFENIVDYIIDKMESNQLQCLSYKDFYHKCISK